jgi:hypothetical protein
MIRIYGNLGNPAAVILNQATSGVFLSWDGAGGSDLNIGGFTLNGFETSGTTAIRVTHATLIIDQTIRITNFNRGLVTETSNVKTNVNAPFYMTGLTAQGVYVGSGSNVHLAGSSISGPSSAAGTSGVGVEYSSAALFGDAAISNWGIGVACHGGSWAHVVNRITFTGVGTTFSGCTGYTT